MCVIPIFKQLSHLVPLSDGWLLTPPKICVCLFKAWNCLSLWAWIGFCLSACSIGLWQTLSPSAPEHEPELEPAFIPRLILLLGPSPRSLSMCQNQSKANFQRLHQPSLQNHVMFHYSNRLLFLFKSLNLLGLYFQSFGLPPPGLYPPPEPALHHPDPRSQVTSCPSSWRHVGFLSMLHRLPPLSIQPCDSPPNCVFSRLFHPLVLRHVPSASWPPRPPPGPIVSCSLRARKCEYRDQVSATLVGHTVVSEHCRHLHLITSLSVANVGDDQNTRGTLLTTDTNCNLKNDHLSQHLSCTVAFDCTVVPRKLIICIKANVCPFVASLMYLLAL